MENGKKAYEVWKREKDGRISEKDLKKRKEEQKAKMEEEKQRQKKEEASLVVHDLLLIFLKHHIDMTSAT